MSFFRVVAIICLSYSFRITISSLGTDRQTDWLKKNRQSDRRTFERIHFFIVAFVILFICLHIISLRFLCDRQLSSGGYLGHRRIIVCCTHTYLYPYRFHHYLAILAEITSFFAIFIHKSSWYSMALQHFFLRPLGCTC